MRIYVDTSVFGGCFDPEFEIWSNQLIDFFKIGKYTAVISQVSEFELKFAPRHIRQILTGIPIKNLEIAKLTDEARQLSEHYIKEKIVTKKALADTQHIAVATVQQVDLLVSWNFKHIVNYDKIRLYNAVNLKYGYKVLEIRNPRDLTDEK
ncbi:PIN domain protein [candidate division TA06 bacterium]|uniref:PIN domain protein n=1 Tax=candidate division TA06 bacterium TaxID=2250710 RepID=A0A933MKS5_UNCT6|nr:PIN domain protein [candidate division TA06 bacterium]